MLLECKDSTVNIASHRRELWRTVEEDFPESDIVATVYSGEIEYTLDNFEKIERMVGEFEEYASKTGLLDGELELEVRPNYLMQNTK